MRTARLNPATIVASLGSSIFVLTSCSSAPLQLTATPETTQIYAVSLRGDSALVGTGSAAVVVDKNRGTRISLAADGYRPVSRVLTKTDASAGPLQLELTAWRFPVSIDPFDAEVRVDGTVQPRRGLMLEVERGQSRTLEVTKSGYRKLTRRYENIDGARPPVSEKITLTERAVFVTVAPAGTMIEVDGKPLAENAAEVVVPANQCANVRIVRAGFMPVERRYCDGPTLPDLPVSEQLDLRDRVVGVFTEPTTADIYVAGRKVAVGQFGVVVRSGACAEVRVEAPAFATQTREYCNEDNAQPLPFDERVRLEADDSYAFSLESDQANVNFTIEVNTRRDVDTAWKLISQIVTNSFDVVEVTDKETGYLRTGWNIRRFNTRTVRTRVIVKLADFAPLKYTIKLSSETARAGANVKDDELFSEWSRVLLQYKDLVNEVQTRLR
jgi:hypothetical protein